MAALKQAHLDPGALPAHVAIIMDGNGRWAKARGLPRLSGHRAGTEALRRTLEAAIETGVPMLTIYAFSTENWKRPAYEVRGLLFLLEEVIDRQLDELDKAGIQIRHIGWLDNVPDHLRRAIARAVDRTSGNSKLVLNVAFNYGSRAEIVRAVRQIIKDGVRPEQVDEKVIERHLETDGLPDPDLIIRTSGEMRLSNFLLWQSAYAEIYSTETLWPDFGRKDFLAALESYALRERRYGARLEEDDDDEAVPHSGSGAAQAPAGQTPAGPAAPSSSVSGPAASSPAASSPAASSPAASSPPANSSSATSPSTTRGGPGSGHAAPRA
jgi:undecaprenyl diphosphate synthase